MTLDMKSFRANSPLFLAKLSRIFFFFYRISGIYILYRVFFFLAFFLLSSFPFLILFLFLEDIVFRDY